MKLFKRFPTINPLPRKKQYLIPPSEVAKYPALVADIAMLENELMPYFRELDNEALRQQNWYRWMYVFLIFGGSIATILGIVQLAFLTIDWLGIAGAIVAAILAGTTTILRTFNYHERYLNARLATERLRSEYFLFLGHIDLYANDQIRLQNLKKRVVEIKIQGEQGNIAQNSLRSEQTRGQKPKPKGNIAGQYDAQQFLQLYQSHRYTDQSVWYTDRQKEFEAARTEAIFISIGLMFLTAVAGGVEAVNISWLKITCLLLAAICPVLSTAITAYNALYGFEQQAKLYQDTANALLKAQVIAPDATAQSSLSKDEFSKRVDKYVQEVENIFLVEQGQWGQLAKQLKPPEG